MTPELGRIAASMGMLIVHARLDQPEGRGKIERFFRSCREQFLNNLDRKQTLSLDELNERLGALAGPLSPHRAQQPVNHTLAPLAKRYRAHPPTASGHGLPPTVLQRRESNEEGQLVVVIAEAQCSD